MLLISLSLLPLVNAVRVFTTHCTLPEVSTPYVTSPDTRGTLDIVWTCLATTVACVYTVLHLNVPRRQRHGESDFLYGLRKNLESFKWALITALAPELTLSKSAVDVYHARYYIKRLHKNVPATIKGGWTLQHMLYTEMGGFIAKYGPAHDKSDTTTVTTSPKNDQPARTTTYPEAADEASLKEAGLVSQRTSASQETPPEESIWHFMCRDLVSAIENGALPAEAPITTAEIADKSKSDLLAKLLASIQICYFVISIIVRAGQHLPVTQLELGTSAFVPFALSIYACSFLKPKSVAIATTALTAAVLPPIIVESRKSGKKDKIFALIGASMPTDTCIPNDLIEDREDEEECSDGAALIYVITLVLTIVFGSIHLIAWNYQFPSNTDLWLWRAAALVVTALLPAILVVYGLLSILYDMSLQYIRRCKGTWSADVATYIDDPLLIVWATLYIAARLIIIVEMFRCLGYLAPEDFVGTWTASFPHVG